MGVLMCVDDVGELDIAVVGLVFEDWKDPVCLSERSKH